MSRQPSIDRSPERDPTPVEQAALGWVVRCERGLNATEQHTLAAWLAAAPEHRELFAEFGGTWAVMGRADELESVGSITERSDAATVLPFESPAAAQNASGRTQARRPRRVWTSLAAAAAIALAVTGWWRAAPRDSTIATEVGASRKLTLSDGSVVALNTDSAVVTAFAREERRVKLEKGEAFFQVAKDASRPFVVEAAGVGVRAVGTAFNVRVHAAAIEVIVTEGIVRVAPSAGRSGEGEFAELSAGHRVMVPIAPVRATTPSAPVATSFAVASVPADELQRKLAWQGGRLDFSDTALGEMVAEFNRYNRRKLVVPDAELAATRFGGSFRPDDRAGFVRILRENFGIVAEERAGETVLHAAAH